MLNIMNYFLVKISFWDQLKDEFLGIWDAIKDFLLMIKEITYDVVANAVGADTTNMVLIGVGVVAVMLICLAIINKR